VGVNVSRREAIEQRRRNWRIALVIVIVITIPFYCAGILLWGTAPVRGVATPTWTPPGAATATQGLIIVTETPQADMPTITPLPITLFPTASPTTLVLPTLFIPTNTPVAPPTVFVPPATNTLPPPPPPPITNTPLPFDP
jgi:hypothetical protein